MRDVATAPAEVQTLERIADSAHILMMLSYELKAEARVAIERLGGPPADEVVTAYLRAASNRELRRALIEARGTQGAAVLATKLNADLAELGKVRPSLNGRTRARVGNGSSHAGNGHQLEQHG